MNECPGGREEGSRVQFGHPVKDLFPVKLWKAKHAFDAFGVVHCFHKVTVLHWDKSSLGRE